MILDNFGLGWKLKFENLIQFILDTVKESKIVSISRYKGMLNVVFEGVDKHSQYMLDSLTTQIKRDSAITCETCGTQASRKKDLTLLPEVKCLCWKCYALEIDSRESHGTQEDYPEV
jgi:hypothetical protein